MSTPLDTLQLDGWHLDYFTGLALGYEMEIPNSGAGPAYRKGWGHRSFAPTFNGISADLHPVLLKMTTLMRGADGNTDWMARAERCFHFARGNTPAVAMCRALVLSIFGKTVLLPVADDCEDLFA